MTRYRSIMVSSLEKHDREAIYGNSRITLGQEQAGDEARRYLYRDRGISADVVAKFRLGFVPFSAGSEPARSFAGRIVMPIFDAHDDLIALSVRPLDDDVKPKYWNESFSKSDHLYGLNVAKYSFPSTGFAIIVEGQFDVLKMHTHGFSNAVGLMGGAFTPIQANSLKRWISNLVFIMDGDSAGGDHASRAREVIDIFTEKQSRSRKRGSRLKAAFVELKDKMDPASFLERYGGEKMRQEIVAAMKANNMRIPRKWVQ